MRQITNHGQDKRYSHARLGINDRRDAMQAAGLGDSRLYQIVSAITDIE